MEGYIKLWRQARQSDVYQDAGLWQLFCELLFRCAHRRRRTVLKIGRETVTAELQAGECAIRPRLVAQDLRVDVKTLRRRLELLAELGAIELEPTQKYTQVRVSNWAKYQGNGSEGGGKMPEQAGPPSPPPSPPHNKKTKKTKKPSPPTPSRPEPLAPAPSPEEGGEGDLWNDPTERLRRLGMVRARQAVEGAQALGLSPSEVCRVLEQYAGSGKWDLGGLYVRLTQGNWPEVDSDDSERESRYRIEQTRALLEPVKRQKDLGPVGGLPGDWRSSFRSSSDEENA